MENWGTEEKKKDSDVARKILIAIMALVVAIIIIIVVLLYNIKANTFAILVDGKTIDNTQNLLKTVDTTTYINIQELAKILGYDYHVGEYKIFSSDADKCYIKSASETASFYLNSNKVCKLKVEAFTEDYDVFICNNNIIEIGNQLYAPSDAIEVGFNVRIKLSENRMNITTLNALLTSIDNSLNKNKEEATYISLLEEEFDNQKAVLYDYIVLGKKDSGLYSVVTTSGQEILADKYKSIKFLENTKEFLVTNSLDKMGIIDENGKNKIEQLYDSIKVIDNAPKLYLVETNQKYGVIDENGNTIVYPEYDSIGADPTIYKELQNQYVLLDRIIPVCKDNKYGLFDITGNKVLDLKYEGIGCELASVELNGVTKAVNPTIAIEECGGIVIKTGEVYDLFLLVDQKLVSLKVSSIYYIKDNGKENYYMIYKAKELDLIDRLVKAGVIENPNKIQDIPNENNTVNNATTSVNSVMNATTPTITNQTVQNQIQ